MSLQELFRGETAAEAREQVVVDFCAERNMTLPQMFRKWAELSYGGSEDGKAAFKAWMETKYETSTCLAVIRAMWRNGLPVEPLSAEHRELWNAFLVETKWAEPQETENVQTSKSKKKKKKKKPTATVPRPTVSSQTIAEVAPSEPQENVVLGDPEAEIIEPTLPTLHFDFAEIEKLSICALDSVAESLELLYNDPSYLIKRIDHTLSYTIDEVAQCVPATPNGTNREWALRRILFQHHTAWMLWKRIVDVLEQLDTRSLTTENTILTACEQDVGLFWNVWSIGNSVALLITRVYGPELALTISGHGALTGLFTPPSPPMGSRYVTKDGKAHAATTLNVFEYVALRFCLHIEQFDPRMALILVQHLEGKPPQQLAHLPASLLDLVGHLVPAAFLNTFFLSSSNPLESDTAHSFAVRLWDLRKRFAPTQTWARIWEDSLLPQPIINSFLSSGKVSAQYRLNIPLAVSNLELDYLFRLFGDVSLPGNFSKTGWLYEKRAMRHFSSELFSNLQQLCRLQIVVAAPFITGMGLSMMVAGSSRESGPTFDEGTLNLGLIEARISVGRKHAKVFNKLFSDSPPCMKWTEFESAMKAIGFSVMALAGTAVRFDPPGDKDRPIVLYRPHPVADLQHTIVLGIAELLSRRYGWSMETFVRMEKIEEAAVGRVDA